MVQEPHCQQASEESTVLRAPYYSAAELAAMQLPGLPASEGGVRKLAGRQEWTFKEVPGAGGRTGTKKVYLPPSAVLKKILQASSSAPRCTQDGDHKPQHIEKYDLSGLGPVHAVHSPPGIQSEFPADFRNHFDGPALRDAFLTLATLEAASGMRGSPEDRWEQLRRLYDLELDRRDVTRKR